MKQLSLQGVNPFADAPMDAPYEVLMACMTEAEAVRWCIDFARDFGVTQRTIAKLCGWRSQSYLSEIANSDNEKNMPKARIRKFSLATGCRLLEQFYERKEAERKVTGKQTAQDKSRQAVAVMRAQYEARAAA